MKNYTYLLLWVLPLVLGACRTYQQPSSAEVQIYRMDGTQSQSPSAEIESLIGPYKTQLDQLMEEVIGFVEPSMPKQRPESTLGNWLADLLAVQANLLCEEPVDFAIQNYGGIRIPELPAGPLNVGKIYELMPFDNLLVVLELDAELLTTFCNQMAMDGGWPQSAALRYVIQDGQATDIRVAGEQIQDGKTYRVAMPDYIANGGGDCHFFTDQAQENTSRLIRI